MTQTDRMVSGRPQTADAATPGGALHDHRSDARSRRGARRGLLAVPVALALMIPAPALAQTSSTGTSGYNQKPPTPKTTTEPKSGTAPSKEATTPKTAVEPTTSTAPAATTTPAAKAVSPTASKLPFTGLDLRWVLGAGVLLLAAGLSIRLTQRRGVGR